MNKEELIKQFDEKLQQLRDELIAKLEEKKKFEVKLPDMYDTLYYIDDICSEVYITNFVSSARDKDRYLRGFYFNTEEEAKQHLKERRLLFKLQQWAKEKNDGWKPDWSNDDEEKYYITYFEDESIELSWEITWGMINFSKLPYFKTRELARECIERFGDEIKEVLC
nr:MAG TPA: hypothetical protein [Caudoviricetes sp.]